MFHHHQYAPLALAGSSGLPQVRPGRTKCGWLVVTPLPRLGGPLRPADQLRPERGIRPWHGVEWSWLQSKFVSVSQRLRNSDRGRRRFPGPALEGQAVATARDGHLCIPMIALAGEHSGSGNSEAVHGG
jgi:hypothetical protein